MPLSLLHILPPLPHLTLPSLPRLYPSPSKSPLPPRPHQNPVPPCFDPFFRSFPIPLLPHPRSLLSHPPIANALPYLAFSHPILLPLSPFLLSLLTLLRPFASPPYLTFFSSILSPFLPPPLHPPPPLLPHHPLPPKICSFVLGRSPPFSDTSTFPPRLFLRLPLIVL